MKWDWRIFTQWLSDRLNKEPLPGFGAQKNMMPKGRPHPNPPPATARRSAVLLLLYPGRRNDDIQLVLIQRSEDGGAHSGQVAFPGGKVEPYDATLEDTAMREAEEEVALPPTHVRVQGRLSPIYIPVSNFIVHPIVATTHALPLLIPSDVEVAAILVFSFRRDFPNKKILPMVPYRRPGQQIQAPVYMLSNDKIIWGATAMILSELEYLWKEFLEAYTAKN